LRVAGPGAPGYDGRGGWVGDVTDLASGVRTVVRELHASGTALESPMVWSEVFADCDAPGTAVRWRDLMLVSSSGERLLVGTVTVNYQSVTDGGCMTTNASADSSGFVQTTGTTRSTPAARRMSVASR
jgi:hypothetical protein